MPVPTMCDVIHKEPRFKTHATSFDAGFREMAISGLSNHLRGWPAHEGFESRTVKQHDLTRGGWPAHEGFENTF